MEQQYLQLGGVVVIAISLIELIKFIINKYTTNKNNGYEKKMYEAVSNHMTTQLDEGFDRLEKSMTDMRLDLSNKLTEIITILKNK